MEWISSLLVALVRPAVSAVAGDLWRRWRIGRKFVSSEPSSTSPLIRKAISDLEVLVGSNALLTSSVAGILDELKSTGLLELIARDSFYQIDDEGVQVYFEALFARHTPHLALKEQRDASRKLYDTIRFLLRESVRAQISKDLLFIFDTSIHRNRSPSELSNTEKIRTVISQIRPDIAKRVELSGQAILAYRASGTDSSSGFIRSQYPDWLYLTPEQLEQQVKLVSSALIHAYEFVRLDGPAERSYDCEIDKLYVPARLIEATFSITAHALEIREGPETPFTELVTHHSQCAVLGDPGGGKSTLAQRICLDALRNSAQDGRSPLAVKIELRRFVRKGGQSAFESLLDFIASEIARQGNLPKDLQLGNLVHHLLFFGRMIIVFDGVDEIVSAPKRREVIATAQQLTNRFLQDRFIYTCRKTDFVTTPIVGLQLFVLRQFNLDEVKAYFRSASKHVFHRSDEEAANRESEFMKQATQHASEFIKNPLLLALIVWIYNVGQRIPDNRIQLYEECSELLFKRWDSLKEIDPELPEAHWLFQLVTEIAHRLYLLNRAEEGESNTEWLKARALEFFRKVYEGDVENRSRAASDRFVRHLTGRSWVLQERSAGIFEFTHRTFMEYYFAGWLHDVFDGIQVLFDHVAPRIRAGEWTVPIHLAFQMKAAGKLRSAESLTMALIGLLEQTRETDEAWRTADSTKRNEMTIAGTAPKHHPELPNVVQFVVGSVGYLQPSEALMVRVTKALAGAVSTKAEWFSAIGDIVASPTEFQSAIVEGVYQALADDISNRKGHSVGFVVDWLYACYLSRRRRQSVTFTSHVLRFDDVRQRFGEKFLAQVKEGGGLASLPKMTFDLTGSTVSAVSEVGLAMWAASLVPDNRLDWRFIDFGIGLAESIDGVLGLVPVAECSYISFFAGLAPIVPRQRNYQISGGVGVLASIDYQPLQLVSGKLGDCPRQAALSFAVSVIGFTELCTRLRIAPKDSDDSEAGERAKKLGIASGPQKQLVHQLLGEILSRGDLPEDFRRYIEGWMANEHAMFQPAARTEYVDHRQTFSGLKLSTESHMG